MKNMISRVLALTLCAAVVCALPAFAAETADNGAGAPAYMAPVRVWGTVTRLENGAVLLKNSNEEDPYHEVVLHVADTTPVVDAVTGLPLDRALRDGETVYAWVGPAMTLSLPPHATARIIVANIPQDAGAPQYYQVAKVRAQGDGPECVDLVTTDGTELTVLPTAMDSVAKFKPGAQMTLLLTEDGQVAGAVEASGTTARSNAVGIVRGGKVQLLCGTA